MHESIYDGRLMTAGRYYIVEQDYLTAGTHAIRFTHTIFHEDGRRIFRAINFEEARKLLTRLSVYA